VGERFAACERIARLSEALPNPVARSSSQDQYHVLHIPLSDCFHLTETATFEETYRGRISDVRVGPEGTGLFLAQEQKQRLGAYAASQYSRPSQYPM
jgi:hypothetical protein